MGASFKKKIGALAALLTVALLLVGPRAPSSAASSGIGKAAEGTLTIQPKYDDRVVGGCAFDLYRVADIDGGSAALRYNMAQPFSQAGVDLNAAIEGGATALETAAAKLASYSAKPAPDPSGVVSGEKIPLAAGAYLAVQTGAPSGYTKASPFLVFLPYTSADGTAWVYDVVAYPKLGYRSVPVGPPPVVVPQITAVKVVKVWDDAGSEANRPASVVVTLLRDGAEYGSETLSAANGWQCAWTGLDAGSSWSVEESGVPEGYTSLIDSETEGETRAYTITNTYEKIPLSGALFVSKEWNDKGYESKRPSSVKAGLYCDGRLTETAELNAGNDWSYAWTGLDDGKTWTVSELDVANGYRSTVEQAGSAFTITNTCGAGGSGDGAEEIGDGEVPKGEAPQTGLVQWPIPVLLAAGAVLIACGVALGRKKNHG